MRLKQLAMGKTTVLIAASMKYEMIYQYKRQSNKRI